jgi:hypothetical protein
MMTHRNANANKNSLYSNLAFFVSGTALASALVRIPIVLFDRRTLLCVLIGVAPTALFPRDLAFRYFVMWTTLAGAGGLIHLLANHFESILGNSNHQQHFNGSVLIAGVFYALLLIVGLLMLHHFRKKKPTGPS